LVGFVDLADFYAYFKPLSYKIEVPLISTSIVLPGAMGIKPINWIVDLPLSVPTPTNGMILETRGHLTGQVGASNLGRWSAWPPCQQQLNSLLSLSEPAAVLLAAGAGSATSVVFNVSVTIHFYRRGILSSAPALTDVDILKGSGLTAEQKLFAAAARLEAKRKVEREVSEKDQVKLPGVLPGKQSVCQDFVDLHQSVCNTRAQSACSHSRNG
jgi:hypothetical protein